MACATNQRTFPNKTGNPLAELCVGIKHALGCSNSKVSNASVALKTDGWLSGASCEWKSISAFKLLLHAENCLCSPLQRSRTWCPRCRRFSQQTPCSEWPVDHHAADLSQRFGGREEVSGCPQRAECTRMTGIWSSVPQRGAIQASSPAWPRTRQDAGHRSSPSLWPVSHAQTN